jgi:DNA topoisomerase-1
VWLKTGRFGAYVEMVAKDDRRAGEKPKRASLPKDWPPATMDVDKGLRLLNLPREIGAHPEDGKMITAGLGRYGPFVLHDGTYASLETPRRCSTSASTAPSPCWPRSGPAAGVRSAARPRP